MSEPSADEPTVHPDVPAPQEPEAESEPEREAGPEPEPEPEPPTGLAAIGADVDWTDREAGLRAARAMPRDAGRLRELADWLASVQASASPRSPRQPRLVLFGRPASELVADLATTGDVGIRVLGEPPADHAAALAAGAELADREVDGGADLLIAAVPGPGLATVVAVSVLTDTEPTRMMPRGVAAAEPRAWMRRTAALRDRRRGVAALRGDPDGLLAALADPLLAAAAGFVLRAAARRTPVLVDGLGAAAAALIAYQAQPRLVRWLAAATTTPDPGHTLIVSTLGLQCVLALDIGSGDGTAALLGVPVLRAAARMAAAGIHGDAT